MDLQPAIIGLLALLAIGIAWVVLELRKLNSTLGPILGSSIGQAIAQL